MFDLKGVIRIKPAVKKIIVEMEKKRKGEKDLV